MRMRFAPPPPYHFLYMNCIFATAHLPRTCNFQLCLRAVRQASRGLPTSCVRGLDRINNLSHGFSLVLLGPCNRYGADFRWELGG